MRQCEDLEGHLHEGRQHEPVQLAVAMEILERDAETTSTCPICLENGDPAVCIDSSPGRHRYLRPQRFIDRGNPVVAEGFYQRAGMSMVPKAGCEKRVDRIFISGVEIDYPRATEIRFTSRRQSSTKLAYSTNTRGRARVCLSASRLYFSHKAQVSPASLERNSDYRRRFASDAMTSCGSAHSQPKATISASPASRAASNHMPDSAVIFGSLMTTSGTAGSVVRNVLILAMSAAFFLGRTHSPRACGVSGRTRSCRDGAGSLR